MYVYVLCTYICIFVRENENLRLKENVATDEGKDRNET